MRTYGSARRIDSAALVMAAVVMAAAWGAGGGGAEGVPAAPPAGERRWVMDHGDLCYMTAPAPFSRLAWSAPGLGGGDHRLRRRLDLHEQRHPLGRHHRSSVSTSCLHQHHLQ